MEMRLNEHYYLTINKVYNKVCVIIWSDISHMVKFTLLSIGKFG